MRLTTKGRYAVMAMADLALFKDKGPTSLTDISLRQNISLAYLEQIFIKLKSKNWPDTITYFNQEMLKKNILASDRCYANLKHDDKSIKIYKNACEEIFHKISNLEKKGILKKKLEGPVKQMGFKRLT